MGFRTTVMIVAARWHLVRLTSTGKSGFSLNHNFQITRYAWTIAYQMNLSQAALSSRTLGSNLMPLVSLSQASLSASHLSKVQILSQRLSARWINAFLTFLMTMCFFTHTGRLALTSLEKYGLPTYARTTDSARRVRQNSLQVEVTIEL